MGKNADKSKWCIFIITINTICHHPCVLVGILFIFFNIHTYIYIHTRAHKPGYNHPQTGDSSGQSIPLCSVNCNTTAPNLFELLAALLMFPPALRGDNRGKANRGSQPLRSSEGAEGLCKVTSGPETSLYEGKNNGLNIWYPAPPGKGLLFYSTPMMSCSCAFELDLFSIVKSCDIFFI